MGKHYWCKNEGRRQAVRGSDKINGIDYLEVSLDQKTIEVHFIHNLPGSGASNCVPDDPNMALKPENIVIDGGVRIKGISVDGYISASENILAVPVNTPGDFSVYTLRLVKSKSSLAPPDYFDPQLCEVDFTFKVGCPSEFDCKADLACTFEGLSTPPINYLAKDYASFRSLILDRVSMIMPDWKERNPADLQIALVELLAYVGDHLSYYQDAVASEAYLGTARKRISVRRHARLLDYFMHEGCNARVWVHLKVAPGGDADGMLLPAGTPLLTKGQDETAMLGPDKWEEIADAENAEVFETMHDITLNSAHNEIRFYTWDDTECCLPRGATQATLYNDSYNPSLCLKSGDVLIFEEVRCPATKRPEDADPAHRHAVRLKRADSIKDPLKDDTTLINIEWDEEDALPCPFCICSLATDEFGNQETLDLSIARGNIVLADHGRTIRNEPLVLNVVLEGGLYRPHLPQGPLTHQGDFDPSKSATSAMHWDIKKAHPVIDLESEGGHWEPLYDLLSSDKFSTEFVIEAESDGISYLRFGDDMFGKRPAAGSQFCATYRIGNGRIGNVGPEMISRIVLPGNGIILARNPMAAKGGTNPESIEQVRLFAPHAFLTQERAVTEADYAEAAQRHPQVQNAVATFRWTGSWYTVFVTIDRKGGLPVDTDPDFKKEVLEFMEYFRMAGFDLEIEGPVFVPLDIALEVCVKPGYFRSNIKKSLLEVFSNKETRIGRYGFFHPDNFTFGQPVYISQIHREAMGIEGIVFVEVTKFQRWGKKTNREVEDGVLKTDRLEVVRLDNDQNFPENGTIEFEMKGGS